MTSAALSIILENLKRDLINQNIPQSLSDDILKSVESFDSVDQKQNNRLWTQMFAASLEAENVAHVYGYSVGESDVNDSNINAVRHRAYNAEDVKVIIVLCEDSENIDEFNELASKHDLKIRRAGSSVLFYFPALLFVDIFNGQGSISE